MDQIQSKIGQERNRRRQEQSSTASITQGSSASTPVSPIYSPEYSYAKSSNIENPITGLWNVPEEESVMSTPVGPFKAPQVRSSAGHILNKTRCLPTRVLRSSTHLSCQSSTVSIPTSSTTLIPKLNPDPSDNTSASILHSDSCLPHLKRPKHSEVRLSATVDTLTLCLTTT